MRSPSPLSSVAVFAAAASVVCVLAFLLLPYSDVYLAGVLGTVGLTVLSALGATAHARRHVLLLFATAAATGFVAFGIAFLRLAGLAFTSEAEAATADLNGAATDTYFYLAAGSFAAMMLLLLVGAWWPRRRRPVPHPRPSAGGHPRPVHPPSTSARPAPRSAANRAPAGHPPARTAQRPGQPVRR